MGTNKTYTQIIDDIYKMIRKNKDSKGVLQRIRKEDPENPRKEWDRVKGVRRKK